LWLRKKEFEEMTEEVMKEKKKKKKPSLKRQLIEWGIIIAIGAFLYLTGLHVQVIGTLQGLVLKTGLIKPKMSTEEPISKADYNFRVIDQDGTLFVGDDLKGKTVFINLWATWCPPCVAEMPDINRLYNEVASDDIVFLMISQDEDFEKAKTFIKKKGYDFTIHQFASAPPSSLYSKIIPTTFVLSPDGNIVVRKEGMAKYNSKSFREFLKSL
jgi:thiol-disulfide isomerase/thioredoxin